MIHETVEAPGLVAVRGRGKPSVMARQLLGSLASEVRRSCALRYRSVDTTRERNSVIVWARSYSANKEYYKPINKQKRRRLLTFWRKWRCRRPSPKANNRSQWKRPFCQMIYLIISAWRGSLQGWIKSFATRSCKLTSARGSWPGGSRPGCGQRGPLPRRFATPRVNRRSTL